MSELRAGEVPADAVWYASYGSNIAPERFALYIDGGSLQGVADKAAHRGARDSSAPMATALDRVPHRLVFAGHSSRWGGSPAFLHLEPGSGSAVIRRWLVTAEQFEDVAAQENGMEPGSLAIDIDALVAAGVLDITDRWYGKALCLGEVDGHPVVTFTGTRAGLDVGAPSSSYLGTIVGGMAEGGMSTDEIVATILEADGVVPAWTAGSIADLVDSTRR